MLLVLGMLLMLGLMLLVMLLMLSMLLRLRLLLLAVGAKVHGRLVATSQLGLLAIMVRTGVPGGLVSKRALRLLLLRLQLLLLMRRKMMLLQGRHRRRGLTP